jgi:hypothetical protein
VRSRRPSPVPSPPLRDPAWESLRSRTQIHVRPAVNARPDTSAPGETVPE